MSSIVTAEEVVRRIAAECAVVDGGGGVGIWLKPAVEIVRRYGEQFHAAQSREQVRSATKKQATLI